MWVEQLSGKLHFHNWKALNWQKTGENKSFHSCSGLLNYFFVLQQRFLIRAMISSKPTAVVTCVNEQEVYTSKAPSPVRLHTPNLQQQLLFHKSIALLQGIHNNLSPKQTLHACFCSGFTKAAVMVIKMQKKKCSLSPSFDTWCNFLWIIISLKSAEWLCWPACSFTSMKGYNISLEIKQQKDKKDKPDQKSVLQIRFHSVYSWEQPVYF